MHSSQVPVGILSLEGTRVTGNGSIYDPQLLAEPRAQITVEGATTSEVVGRPELLITPYQRAAAALVDGGAELLVSNCGLSMTHQSAVGDFTQKPTIMSSLLLLPLLWKIFGGGVGLLTYDAGALTSERLREECGWSSGMTPVVGDVRRYDSWLSLELAAGPLPIERMEADLRNVTCEVVSRGGNRVILVECTAMLPHMEAIRQEAGVPVFDVVALANFVRMGMSHALSD